MRYEQTRSQPDSGIQKNQSNPTQPNIQAQNIRPQNISNINNKPIERNVQQAPNYQPQQQQQQGYRLPTAGQPNYQPQNPQAQPVIRPPGNPVIRQVINPNQPPPIRNIPPLSNQPIRPPINPLQQQQPQQQFRPPPPQQFQRPTFQAPQEQQPQQLYRPVAPPINAQRQPIPEQKVIRNPPPSQNLNMMSEINRERTFTTSHEPSLDDDDDVVVGRMVTPQARPVINSKPVENYEQRPMMGARETVQPPMQPPQRPMPSQPPPQTAAMQRRESVQSIPSRPPSGLGSNNSQSPEPRMNPNPQTNVQPPQQQQQFANRMDPGNRNIQNEMSRPSPNNDYARDITEPSERVQRPMNQMPNVPQQRQSPDDYIQRQNPKINQQPNPPPQQFRPAPMREQIPQSDAHAKQNQDLKKTQPEHFTQQQQQNLNEHKQNPSALKMQDQRRNADPMKAAENLSKKSSVRLDLGKSENMRSAKDKSPSSKTQQFFIHSLSGSC